MGKWIFVIGIVAVVSVFGIPQLKKLPWFQQTDCTTSNIRNLTSPDGRFVAHFEEEECRSRDSQLRIWLSVRDRPAHHETVFAAKVAQWLPDANRSERLSVNLAWTRGDELTIYFPKGVAVEGDPGRKGIGVEVVYHDETLQR